MSPRLLLLLPPMLWGGLLAQGSRRSPRRAPVTVQEGLCVFIPCKLSYYPAFSSYLFLFKKVVDIKHGLPVATNKPNQEVQERTKGRFFFVDSDVSNCSLTIRDVNMRDNGMYFLYTQVFSSLKYASENFSLKVEALTQTPDIFIPGTLESGRPRNLTCSAPWACEQNTPPIFSWTSAAHTSLGPRSHHLSSMLTLTPRPQDHGTNLACQVHFPASGVTVETTIQLNVTYAPQNMAISVFQGNSTALKILQNTSLPIPEGEALRLLCVAESNPPAQLSWVRGSPALNPTPVSSTAMLELPRGLGTAEGEFTCQAQHPLGSRSLSLSLLVFYPPQLLGPSCSWEDQGLLCNCSSRAQPAPSVRWRLWEGLLEGNHSNASYTVTSRSAGPWANSSLSLSGELSAGLRISCEARNVHGAPSAAVLLLPGKPEPRAKGVLGVVGGSSIMILALLSFCLCLIFRVKICKEKAAQLVQSLDNDVNPVVGSGSGVHQHQFQTDSPSAPPGPDGASPVANEEQELHYAFIRFHNLKHQEDANIVYSEIKTHK
ncbi:sialic acid-binding Ig-like lectin 5 [Molossus molossus]|uniref:sialic acid-binding Ig-like lectin 5 n=1 Tax=Molossus molossus TaxID=27622 RepID=UPI001746B527|nr:sialic acid-binding Ig-like lectin 5 [Molossus molossus]